MEPRYRLATTDDEDGILDALRDCFPQLTFSPEWWRWFQSGPSRTYICQDASNALVEGIYSVIECPCRYDGEDMMNFHSCNLALRARHRRAMTGNNASHFTAFAQHVWAEEKRRGMGLGLVVPNPRSKGTFLRHGWQILDELHFYTNRQLASRPGFSYPEDSALIFDDGYDRLIDSLKNDQIFGLLKSGSYLTWRLSRPDSSYRMKVIRLDREWQGFVVIKEFHDTAARETRVHIMEIAAQTEAVLHRLIDWAEACAASRALLNVSVLPGTVLARVLTDRGFVSELARPLLYSRFAQPHEAPRPCDRSFSFADNDVY